MASTFFVLFLACIFQRSFGVYFKKCQLFSWKAFWVLSSFIGVLCILYIWCMVEAPHYLSYIAITPVPTLIVGALSGSFWGISSIRYSEATDMIGVSLVIGINLGLSNLLGSLVPMIIPGTYPPARVLMVLPLGQLMPLDGVIALPRADSMKDGNNEDIKAIEEKGTSSLFITGLIMALAFGAGSAAVNIGAIAANYPVALTVKEGVNPIGVSLPSWVAVFVGGFLASFVYAISKLIKNRTYADYTKPGCAKAYSKVVLTLIVWFNALATYSKAIALLDTLGLVVGWAAFNGLALITANAWGFLDGEWKGFEKVKRVAIHGNAVTIAALVVVGISDGS